jgi:tetratricopeptide (TPR) repeat protein
MNVDWHSYCVAVALAAVLSGCGSDKPQISTAKQLFVDAQKQIAQGNKEEALKLLGQSLDAEPSEWSYMARAKLLMELDRDEDALKDCAAAIALSPDDPDPDAIWLQGELKKPKGERFQGRFKQAPSSIR